MLGEMAGAGSEVYGVQRRKEKQTDSLAAHLKEGPVCGSCLLPRVPNEARMVESGQREEKEEQSNTFGEAISFTQLSAWTRSPGMRSDNTPKVQRVATEERIF